MPKKTNVIEIRTDAKIYIRDVMRCPLCNI